MDPYRALGVPGDCTREEVKAAFRARVPFAHPDRGGEDATFIHLRAAYEQILAELDRRPTPGTDTNRSPRAPRHDGTAKQRASTGNFDRAADEEAPREQHPPKPPNPGATREAYIALLRGVSVRASH